MSLHRWKRVIAGAQKCRRCSSELEPGDPYREVTQQNWPYCAPCAKAILDEEPPENVLAAVTVDPQQPSPFSFSKFTPDSARRAWKTTRQHDARMRQTGDGDDAA